MAGPFQINISFSTPVTGLEASDFETNDNVVDGVFGLKGEGAKYTASVIPLGSGEVRVSLPAGAALDRCGDYNLASDPFSVRAEVDRPTVKLYMYEPAPVVGPFNLYITFSEEVIVRDIYSVKGSKYTQFR